MEKCDEKRRQKKHVVISSPHFGSVGTLSEHFEGPHVTQFERRKRANLGQRVVEKRAANPLPYVPDILENWRADITPKR